jgi:2,4-dienoyl-CoA reductase-like NADH-dependent reductase (Old Yellow Enzyme family)
MDMNIDGIDPSQIEGLRAPFLEKAPTQAIREAKPEEVKVETEKLQQLAQQARELPENRPDVVARGRELLADPNYPSADVEEGIAKILLGLQEEAY